MWDDDHEDAAGCGARSSVSPFLPASIGRRHGVHALVIWLTFGCQSCYTSTKRDGSSLPQTEATPTLTTKPPALVFGLETGGFVVP